MKRCAWHLLAVASLVLAGGVRAETETIDLKALAKKARPAVLLLVVSDAAGKEIATGTGFLVSGDGKLITNHHVIENAASAVAKAENGGLFPVEGVLADDPKNDLVLLKLKGKDLPFLTLGDSDKIEVGERVAVIGSPLGLEGTMSEGIVSAVRGLMEEMKTLQITAAVSPGSSGSPVLNAKGEVIGVATALVSGGQALNFAVPSAVAKRALLDKTTAGALRPLREFVTSELDRLWADTDYRAFLTAKAADNQVEMLKHAQAFVRKFPENVEAYLVLGTVYLEMKFNDDAIAAYQQAIKRKPDDAGAWRLLGIGYEAADRYGEAVSAFSQATKCDPEDAGGWKDLGDAYRKTGQLADAIVAYRQAIKLKPDWVETWQSLGDAYRESGRLDDALNAFDKAKRLKAKTSK